MCIERNIEYWLTKELPNDWEELSINKQGEWIPFTPYDHQVDAAYKILKNRFCMAEVATSGGKSLIISIVIFYTLKNLKVDSKFLLIVPSITLVTQFMSL